MTGAMLALPLIRHLRRTFSHRLAVLTAFCAFATLALPLLADDPAASQPRESIQSFFKSHCLDCHAGAKPEGGLNLEKLTDRLTDPEVLQRWVRIVDRVHDGEMPPADAEKPAPAEASAFLNATGNWLRGFQHAQDAQLGRVRG